MKNKGASVRKIIVTNAITITTNVLSDIVPTPQYKSTTAIQFVFTVAESANLQSAVLCLTDMLVNTKRLEGKAIITFHKSSVQLNEGFTYIDYVIKRNELLASYNELCEALGISLKDAKSSYDKTFNLPLSKVGTLQTSQLICALSRPSKLKYLKTGTDWRANEQNSI